MRTSTASPRTDAAGTRLCRALGRRCAGRVLAVAAHRPPASRQLRTARDGRAGRKHTQPSCCWWQRRETGRTEASSLRREVVGLAYTFAPAAPSATEDPRQVVRSVGRPLESRVRAVMERRFAEDFGAVRIHVDGLAAKSAEAVNAAAYSVGEHVVFARDRYAPHVPAGERLLVHELVHVVQQRRGGAAPSPLPGGAHERSARDAAESASSGCITVQGASGPGIARQPSALAQSMDPARLSAEVLAGELDLMVRWLMDQPSSSQERLEVTAALARYTREALRRIGGVRPTGEQERRPGPEVSAAAMGGAVAVRGLAVTGEGAAAGTGLLSASVAASLGMLAGLGVLLWSSDTIVRGEDEARALENWRASRLSGTSAVTLATVKALLIAPVQDAPVAVTPMTTTEVDVWGGKVDDIVGPIEELLSGAGQAVMRCSAEVLAFREAARALREYLAGPPDQLTVFQLMPLFESLRRAARALLACLGVPV
ncbi:DUF4157 domain-containing protein [Geodermatophilus sp. SYSU D00691]